MSQPVSEDRYDDLSYFGLTVGTVAAMTAVAAFLGAFIYVVVRSMGRVVFV